MRILQMGGLQCLEERCFSAGVMQLSESMWRHGFYVGVVDTGNSQPDEVKGISLAVPPLCPNPPSKKRFDEIRKHIKAIRSAKQEQPKKAMSDRYGKHSLCLVPDRGSNEVSTLLARAAAEPVFCVLHAYHLLPCR